ncbi:hypothetical protein AA106555_1067 [Neokomagataea thailandica NBRC 106555]|uniref:Hedgehog/Intein (Hint) domain-containing protein n=2 Tax=Neokomagataea TaxID=1223423 RepID=A0A4Y6V6H4_9PROT|nr:MULTISPECIES: Hint domain-containing protein [Neokomagataea]QDH24230.1 hypothetical protein D5366_01960 [Neokomagataea tanensis]GBR52866.1 hypothetical protein AA106555_1067 [Neokomagataea thailandica NBRC 106555]
MLTINSSQDISATDGIVWDLTVEGNGTSNPVDVNFIPSADSSASPAINVNNLTINGGAVVDISKNVGNIAIGTINLNGGTLIIDQSIMENNENLVINVGSSGGEILFSPTSNLNDTIPLNFTSGSPGNLVMGFVGAKSVTLQYDPSLDSTVLAADDGRYVAVNANPYNLPEDGGTQVFDNASADGVVLACFLAGALIATPKGEKTVESIKLGDEILALVEGEWVSRRVVRIKERVGSAQNGVPDDLSGYPVCILEGAFGPALPSQDLFVTAEHCFLLDGKFVPIRMLVNGTSVKYENIETYKYYHIETEEHSIISANGLKTESYLNTESRVSYYNAEDNIIKLKIQVNSWACNAAAPLDTTRNFVEPLYRAIQDRSKQARYEKQSLLSKEAGFASAMWLEVEGGEKIHATRRNDTHSVFLVPQGISRVYLCSEAARPCDVVGPYVDDRRSLGAFVRSLHIFNEYSAKRKEFHPSDIDADGWLERESTAGRWTNGRAAVDFGCEVARSPYVLSVDATFLGEVLVKPESAAA